MPTKTDFVVRGIETFENDEELYHQEYFSEDGILVSWEDLYRQEMELIHRENNLFYIMAGATADIGMRVDTR